MTANANPLVEIWFKTSFWGGVKEQNTYSHTMPKGEADLSLSVRASGVPKVSKSKIKN